jgi:hypothetical protein
MFFLMFFFKFILPKKKSLIVPEFHTDVGAGSAAPNGKLPLHFEKKEGTMFFPH